MKQAHLCALMALALACKLQRSPEPPAGSTSADSTAVVRAVEQYRQAWLRGDTAAALARVSKDIRIFISGVPDVIGFDATRKLFVDEMSTYDVPMLNLDRLQLIMSGDHAIDIGTYEEIQMPKHGAPLRNRGRYLTIWHREGNDWRIFRYMLSDLPPPPSASHH
jgi:ketosteroid isomerase-like protein